MPRYLVNGKTWPTLGAGVSRVWKRRQTDQQGLSFDVGWGCRLFCNSAWGGETPVRAARHRKDIVERAKI